MTRSKWHHSLATLAIAGALAIGATLAWAALPAQEIYADAADDKTAAIQAFNQAKVLYQQNKYAEAAALNDKALKLDPTNKNAQLLQKILQSKIGDTPSSPTPTGNPNENPRGKIKQLTLEQVSQIRLAELTPNESSVRGSIDRNALEDFWNKILKNQPGVNHDAFVNPNNFPNQLQQFRNANAPDFLSHVQITSDPADMLEYRKTVHAFVLKNCATSSCHGGDKAGDFRLILPSPPVTDQLLYTNFYIMSMYATKDSGKMINRDDPDMSLFIQYSLPKDTAKLIHPGNVEIHPLSKSDMDQLRTMSDWVRSLALPRPNYNVVYELPNSPATTHPATKPATTSHTVIHPQK